MTAKSFLRAGALELLRGMAWDLALIYQAGKIPLPQFWQDAKRIEKRFQLCGYTSREVNRLDNLAKFNSSVRKIRAVNSMFEPQEIDRIGRAVARQNLRDLLRIYYGQTFNENFGHGARQLALSLI